MCGGFPLTKAPAEVAEHFHLDGIPSLQPRYNVASTQQVFALRSAGDGAREGVFLKWGLVPSWASDPSVGVRTLNARAETVEDKPAFRPRRWLPEHSRGPRRGYSGFDRDAGRGAPVPRAPRPDFGLRPCRVSAEGSPGVTRHQDLLANPVTELCLE
jgi:hypothetical protein